MRMSWRDRSGGPPARAEMARQVGQLVRPALERDAERVATAGRDRARRGPGTSPGRPAPGAAGGAARSARSSAPRPSRRCSPSPSRSPYRQARPAGAAAAAPARWPVRNRMRSAMRLARERGRSAIGRGQFAPATAPRASLELGEAPRVLEVDARADRPAPCPSAPRGPSPARCRRRTRSPARGICRPGRTRWWPGCRRCRERIWRPCWTSPAPRTSV